MSLTHDDLADIKQLMEATVGAAMKEQDKHFEALEKQMNKRFDEVDKRFNEVDERFDEVLDAIGADLSEHDKQLNDHEVRITRLEKRAA